MFRLTTLLILSVLVCTGCASTIGNVSDINEVAFEVGGTNKSQVADALGFPEHRVVENKIEYWGYRNKPALAGVIYAFPSGGNTVTTYTVTDIHNVPLGMTAAAVIYAFDDDGVLVDVREANK
ncbi:MAG: hypothetical protein ACR2PZ_24345 [Pseudomonadales bacterium]